MNKHCFLFVNSLIDLEYQMKNFDEKLEGLSDENDIIDEENMGMETTRKKRYAKNLEWISL